MSEYPEAEAWYAGLSNDDAIRIRYGNLVDGEYFDLDIKAAVYLRYQLDLAISDHAKAAGR